MNKFIAGYKIHFMSKDINDFSYDPDYSGACYSVACGIENIVNASTNPKKVTCKRCKETSIYKYELDMRKRYEGVY